MNNHCDYNYKYNYIDVNDYDDNDIRDDCNGWTFSTLGRHKRRRRDRISDDTNDADESPISNDTNDADVIDSRLSDDTSDTNGADTDVIDSQNSDNFPGFGTWNVTENLFW